MEEMLDTIIANQEEILLNQETQDVKLNDIIEQLNNINLDSDGFQTRVED